MTEISDTQELILTFLARALFNRDILIPDNLDWDEVYKEADVQTVLPLVYVAVSDSLPSEIKSKWQLAIYEILANNVKIIYEHKEAHRILTEGNIPYVIIKGTASARYYPIPKLRMMGDVDFVVRKEDLARTGELLEKQAFIWMEDKEHTAHHVYYRDSSIWEVHWGMSGIPTGENGIKTRELFSEIIDTAVYDESGYMIPDEFHHGLVLLIHTAEHLVNTGIGLRHLCDWAVFVEGYSDENFKDIFEEKLKACGLWRFAQLLTQLSVCYLGVSEKEWAGQDTNEIYLQNLISDIFASGNFGRKDSERINQAKLFTNQGKGTIGDVGFLRQIISTLNERAKRVLPNLRKMPILLPIGWIYVVIRHMLRIKKGARPSIHMRRMIKGASDRRDIYRKFHLFECERPR